MTACAVLSYNTPASANVQWQSKGPDALVAYGNDATGYVALRVGFSRSPCIAPIAAVIFSRKKNIGKQIRVENFSGIRKDMYWDAGSRDYGGKTFKVIHENGEIYAMRADPELVFSLSNARKIGILLPKTFKRVTVPNPAGFSDALMGASRFLCG